LYSVLQFILLFALLPCTPVHLLCIPPYCSHHLLPRSPTLRFLLSFPRQVRTFLPSPSDCSLSPPSTTAVWVICFSYSIPWLVPNQQIACKQMYAKHLQHSICFLRVGLVYRHFGKEVISRLAGIPVDDPNMDAIYLQVYKVQIKS